MTEGKDVRGLIRVSSSQIGVFWGLMRVIRGLIVVNESESRVFCGHSAFSFTQKREVRLSGHLVSYNAVTRLREANKDWNKQCMPTRVWWRQPMPAHDTKAWWSTKKRWKCLILRTRLVPTWHRKTLENLGISTLFEARPANIVVLFDLFWRKYGQ